MVREIDLEQVALNLQSAVRDVHEGRDHLVVVHRGRRIMAMVPIEAFERWFAERDQAFQYVDSLPTRNLPYSEDEVAADIERAIREVRGNDPTP